MSTVQKTHLEGVLEIERPTFPDDRGFFHETFRKSELEEVWGKEFIVRQANHSRSSKHTLRGIHRAPWNKLIYVSRGKVQAVIVDLREGSSTFGKYVSFIIGDENKKSIFIPAYCGNSYLVLSDEADYHYLTDEEWAPNKETAIAWNDPELAITWEVTKGLLLSEKDQGNPTINEAFADKVDSM
jgi:dTDP-4-dehydrorhamnose 3,5-epimerase